MLGIPSEEAEEAPERLPGFFFGIPFFGIPAGGGVQGEGEGVADDEWGCRSSLRRLRLLVE